MKEFSYGIAPYKLIGNDIFLLVCKSSKNSLYGFVKGKIELNESIKECLVREIKEETNLKIEIRYLEKYFYQKYKRKDIGIFTINSKNIDLSKTKLNNKELYSLEYIKLDYNLYLNFLNNQKQILNQVFLEFKNKKNYQLSSLF